MNVFRLVAAVALAALARSQDALVVPLADRHPEVGNLSSWIRRTEHRGGAVDKSRRGVFPVGDGHVFGYFGLAERAAHGQMVPSSSLRSPDPPPPAPRRKALLGRDHGPC